MMGGGGGGGVEATLEALFEEAEAAAVLPRAFVDEIEPPLSCRAGGGGREPLSVPPAVIPGSATPALIPVALGVRSNGGGGDFALSFTEPGGRRAGGCGEEPTLPAESWRPSGCLSVPFAAGGGAVERAEFPLATGTGGGGGRD
jgi:hypothetical protein